MIHFCSFNITFKGRTGVEFVLAKGIQCQSRQSSVCHIINGVLQIHVMKIVLPQRIIITFSTDNTSPPTEKDDSMTTAFHQAPSAAPLQLKPSSSCGISSVVNN